MFCEAPVHTFGNVCQLFSIFPFYVGMVGARIRGETKRKNPALHAWTSLRHPHCAVSGLLLASSGRSNTGQIVLTDCIPLFHQSEGIL